MDFKQTLLRKHNEIGCGPGVVTVFPAHTPDAWKVYPIDAVELGCILKPSDQDYFEKLLNHGKSNAILTRFDLELEMHTNHYDKYCNVLRKEDQIAWAKKSKIVKPDKEPYYEAYLGQGVIKEITAEHVKVQVRPEGSKGKPSTICLKTTKNVTLIRKGAWDY